MKRYFNWLRRLIAVLAAGMLLMVFCSEKGTSDSQPDMMQADSTETAVPADSAAGAERSMVRAQADTTADLAQMASRLDTLMNRLKRKQTDLDAREKELQQVENDLHRQQWIVWTVLIIGLAFLLGGYVYLYRKTHAEQTDNKAKSEGSGDPEK